MATTPTFSSLPTNPTNKDTVYIDYLAKFKKEASYFEVERTANGKPWPRAKQPTEIAYHNFLAEVVDPTSGDYYFIVQNDEKVTAKYIIDRIVREKTISGKEFLYSEGYIEAYDYFKDNKRFRCSKPEVHTKTNFEHRKKLNAKNQIERVTLGPRGSETVYEMPFTAENAEILWSKKRDGNISLILKNASGEPHLLERKGSISADDFEGAFQLFKTAPFEHLYSWDYMNKNTVPQQPTTKEVSDSNLVHQKEMVTVAELEDEISRAKPDTKTKVNSSTNPDRVK